MHQYRYHVIQPINGDTDFYFMAGFTYPDDAATYCNTYNARGEGDGYGFPARVWEPRA